MRKRKGIARTRLLLRPLVTMETLVLDDRHIDGRPQPHRRRGEPSGRGSPQAGEGGGRGEDSLGQDYRIPGIPIEA